ncbi:restriction endonuclease subunit S [Endozoicomonas sp. SESOKO2]|uniref:restriction endonuclease subunit S n=1 Tax=Endozoicomonas sp. SESOKO2 TaxID=2828743 RepID=UPI002147E1A8|nr:restriction endonuclease subunit S [Endozoicomonas sp. SESOKO2]
MQLVLTDDNKLPEGWLLTGLSEFRNSKSESFNPKNEAERELELYSVPSHATGKPESIPCSEIGSNKQYVATGDVLISKINPRLNRTWVVGDFTVNDKIASTEWIVFKKHPAVSSTFLKYLLESYRVRDFLAHNASGVGGSLTRVKPNIFDRIQIALPPANEQTRIVEKIEELFSELDKGMESLKTAQQQLKVYRQALLKQAFEGKLTEQWRADNPDKVESAEKLLDRIKTEREARYQQQLEEWKQAVKEWEAAGKEGKKPAKPKKPKSIDLLKPEEHNLPSTPDSWIWVNYGMLCELVRNGISKKPVGEIGDKIFRISAVRPMFFDMEDYRYIQNTKGEYNSYYLQKGDILFTRYNGSRRYVGVGAEYKSNEKRLYPDKLIQTRIANTSISPSFMEKAVNSGFSRKALEKQIRTTAGQSGVSGEDIKNIPVPLCSHEEQQALIVLLDGQLSVIDSMEKDVSIHIQKAEALRQSILKKAFSGQLVSQNPDDEPASELLGRIRQEREAAEQAAKEAKKAAKKTTRKQSHPGSKKPKASAA